jgi:transposase
VVQRPEATEDLPQHLCLDAAFVGEEHEESVKIRDYTPHIRQRGEKKKKIKKTPNFKPRRWVVEVCHSWLNRFRKLLIRFEKKSENYLNLLYFACSLISWRQVLIVHS